MATDSVSESVGKMLSAFTSDQVPDLVLRRMKGEQVDASLTNLRQVIAAV